MSTSNKFPDPTIVTLSLTTGDRTYAVVMEAEQAPTASDVWEWLQVFGMPGIGFRQDIH